MRRILIVGSSGAGKSTLAREIARRLDLPLIHLDRHYWRPGWVPASDAEFRAEVAALAARPAWVLDGNHPRRSRPRVLAAARTIAPDLPVLRLRTAADTRRFLATLPAAPR